MLQTDSRWGFRLTLRMSDRAFYEQIYKQFVSDSTKLVHSQTETQNPVASPADFGSDEISMAMKPRKLKRYSMVNTTTSHAFMREDPAGDWVAWSEVERKGNDVCLGMDARTSESSNARTPHRNVRDINENETPNAPGERPSK